MVRRLRLEVKGLGFLLRHFRRDPDTSQLRLLLPIMFWRARKNVGPPDGRQVEATVDELRSALRMVFLVLLVAAKPIEGVDPQVQDDARWALACFGVTASEFTPAGRDTPHEEFLRRIDEEVARQVDELVALSEAEHGPPSLRVAPPRRRSRPRRAGRTGGRGRRTTW